MCSGAAASLTLGATVLGELHPGAVTPAGWGWLVSLAVVSTVAAVTMVPTGLSRVGATTASIVSTAEPLVTVVLAGVVVLNAGG